jgi:hypothetical protein
MSQTDEIEMPIFLASSSIEIPARFLACLKRSEGETASDISIHSREGSGALGSIKM